MNRNKRIFAIFRNFKNCFFFKNEVLFVYEDFIILNIDEKKFPVNNQLAKNNEYLDDDQGSSKQVARQDMKYRIPKRVLLDVLESIPNERYYQLIYGISKKMIDDKTAGGLKNFFERSLPEILGMPK